jgi:hypothetical protein
MTQNPFQIPERTLEEPGPLNPWQVPQHNDYYASVDHADQAYRSFLDKYQQWNIAVSGGMVLVSGHDGCGKTSLIHRCACKIKSGATQIEIVDRSHERLDGLTAAGKCEEVVRALLRQMQRLEGFLGQRDIQNLPTLPSKPEEADIRHGVEDIAEALKASKRVLVIVPPKLELSSELRTYVRVFARPRVVLLMETNQQDLAEFVERWNSDSANKKIVNLSVGPLEVEHAWIFLESRFKQTSGDGAPRFEQNAVTKYMQNRSQSARVSVRELERVCLKVFENAVQQSKIKVEYEDFADLWLRHGSVLR